jgi:hypothetical protein
MSLSPAAISLGGDNNSGIRKKISHPAMWMRVLLLKNDWNEGMTAGKGMRLRPGIMGNVDGDGEFAEE